MNKYNCFFSALFVILIIFLIQVSIYPQTFTKITQGPFVNDGGASRSVNFVNYDGDGDLDLFVSNGKRFGQYNFLYSNTAGVYTRVFGTAPVMDSLPHDGSSWADFDNDGDLDVCTVTWYDSVNTLFRNDGNGSFTFLSSSPVVTNRGFSETCSWGDYDNDGDFDLFIARQETNTAACVATMGTLTLLKLQPIQLLMRRAIMHVQDGVTMIMTAIWICL
jgi:FG-GAP-like repeat